MKIPTIFIGKPQWEGGWPYIGFDNEELKKSIIDFLNKKFENVEFPSNEIITTYDENLIRKIKEDILEADGILIFTIGHYGDPGIIKAGIEIIEIGKPTILANYVYGGDHTFIKIYTSIKDKNLPVFPISSQIIEDFGKYIEILYNTLSLQGKRILVYASDSIKFNWEKIMELVNPERKIILKEHPEFVSEVGKMRNESSEFYLDLVGLDQAHQWRKDENKYRENLKNIFGIEMKRENPDDIVKYYDDIDEDLAIKIAEKWIKNAKKVEPTEKTILNSAKLYLALKKILKDKNYNIIAPDCGTFLLSGILPAFPCMGFFELSNEGCYGICESDMDCAISYIFGLNLTGRPGFVSNHTLDLEKNQVTYLHCLAANKLYGVDGPSAEYEIVRHGESGILGASPRVKFPIGEPVTTIKISVFEKKIAIRQGKIIDNVVDKKGCVSKMLVESNTRKILENYNWDTFGWHRCTFIGNWKEEFIIAAKLLGLDVVEEDK